MNKLCTLFFLSFLFFQHTNAQSFPTKADNPVWTVRQLVFGSPETIMRSIYLEKDTIIDDQLWHIVKYESEEFQEVPGVIRVDSSKVFFKYFRFNPEEEYLMYDFSLEEGDSVLCHGVLDFRFIPLELTVDHIDTVVYQNIPRKFMRMKYQPDSFFVYYFHWVEGIGTLTDPLYSFNCLAGICEYEPRVVCLQSNDGLLYSSDDGICKNLDKNIIYVNNNLSTGNNNGSSWTHAYHDLQTALQQAAYGDEVWVAGGAYHPDSIDREISFAIPTGVKVYGGFQGTEAVLSERELDDYPTILSGNIGTPEDSTDNSYHVVVMENPDSNTVLDGFTIRDGHGFLSNGSIEKSAGAGLLILKETSGASGWPLINSCHFVNNVARSGGAVYVNSEVEKTGKLTISNSSFNKNKATSLGGGLHLNAGSIQDGVFCEITKCVFNQNHAHAGGALHTINIDSFIITESSFVENQSNIWGGALNIDVFNKRVSFLLERSLLQGNSSGAEGAGIFIFGKSIKGGEFIINESEFYENYSDGLGGGINISKSKGNFSASIRNSIFKDNFAVAGAAIFHYTETETIESLNVENSTFINNKNKNVKGIIHFSENDAVESTKKGHFVLYNSLFAHNDGVFNLGFNSSEDNPSFIYNCTFFHNQQPDQISEPRGVEGKNSVERHVRIRNSLFWEPGHDSLWNVLDNIFPSTVDLTSFDIDNSLFNAPNCDGISSNIICGNDNIFGLNPQFKDTRIANFSLKPCSPAINAGMRDTLFDQLDQGLDLAGNPRLLEDIPDIGAYEVQSLPPFELEIARLPTCSDSRDGELWLSTPPDQPYLIEWGNRLSTNPYLDSLGAGDYTFLLTTEDQCTDSLNYTLEAPEPLEWTYEVFPASGPDIADGGVRIDTIKGGTPPYTVILVQNGQPVEPDQAAPGSYELVVIDSRNCRLSEPVEISFVSDVVELPSEGLLTAFPNPVAQGQPIRVRWMGQEWSPMECHLTDVLGKVIWSNKKQEGFGQEIIIKTFDLEEGLYFLQLENEKGESSVLKILVNR